MDRIQFNCFNVIVLLGFLLGSGVWVSTRHARQLHNWAQNIRCLQLRHFRADEVFYLSEKRAWCASASGLIASWKQELLHSQTSVGHIPATQCTFAHFVAFRGWLRLCIESTRSARRRFHYHCVCVGERHSMCELYATPSGPSGSNAHHFLIFFQQRRKAIKLRQRWSQQWVMGIVSRLSQFTLAYLPTYLVTDSFSFISNIWLIDKLFINELD